MGRTRYPDLHVLEAVFDRRSAAGEKRVQAFGELRPRRACSFSVAWLVSIMGSFLEGYWRRRYVAPEIIPGRKSSLRRERARESRDRTVPIDKSVCAAIVA